MFYVYEHHYGRKLISGSGPCAGLLEWPNHLWRWISKHRSKAAAIEACAASLTHATVNVEHASENIFDNGKPVLVPDGWYHPEAQTCQDFRRSYAA